MDKKAVIAGSLSLLSLAEVFQLLGGNKNTGILSINSVYSEEPGLIYFQEGKAVDAACGTLAGLDAIYALFGWTEGEFEFSKEDITNKDIIKTSQMEIILEGTKMLDEGRVEELGVVAIEGRSSEHTTKESGKIPVIKGPLVDYMYVVDEEDFEDNATIIKQGKHGNWNWVVLDGTVEIRKETPNGQIPIVRVGMGSFVGSIAGLLLQSSVRSATVVSIGRAQLGVLDSQRLAMEYTRLSSTFKEIILSLDKRIKQITNRAVEVFSGKKKDVKEVIKGKKVFIKQGDKEDGIYYIDQGNAYVVRSTKRGLFLLCTLEEGDFIGDVPFLHFGHEPNSASIYVTEDFAINQINRGELENEYEQLSITFQNMIKNASGFLSATTKILCDFKQKRDGN